MPSARRRRLFSSAKTSKTAAVNNEAEGVKALLDQGDDVDIRDDMDRTPLHAIMATTIDDMTIPRILVKHRAEVEAEDRDSMTPLHLAARVHGRDHAITALLLAAGADPSVRDGAGRLPFGE